MGKAAVKSGIKTAKEVNNTEPDEEEEADNDCSLGEEAEETDEAEEEAEGEPFAEDSTLEDTDKQTATLKESFSAMTIVSKPSETLFSVGFTFPHIMCQ